MVSAYAENEILLIMLDSLTGGDDLRVAEEAFASSAGDFGSRFTAAVQAVLARKAVPEVFIQIPDHPQEVSKADLDVLVRPASAFLKSYPSKTELLDELNRIARRQQHRADWIPRVTVDGKPFDSGNDRPAEVDGLGERAVVVGAFEQLGEVVVSVPGVWEGRPELELAEGGIGQLELVLCRLLGIGERGDWSGRLMLDADANEALVPAHSRWWAHGHEPRRLPPGEDPGVASETVAIIDHLGVIPVVDVAADDDGPEILGEALGSVTLWRHSPQWTLRSWEPGTNTSVFTIAQASLGAWATGTSSGLVVYVDGAVLVEDEGVLAVPGPLHSYLLCITRASAGTDDIAAVHRLVLSCPGEHWCALGGCSIADEDTGDALAALLAAIGSSGQIRAAAACHSTAATVYERLYGGGSGDGYAASVFEVCAAALEAEGWKQIEESEIDGGIQELLVRKADRFLTFAFDPLTQQILLRDGRHDLEMFAQILEEEGVIIQSPGQRLVDTSQETIEAWGLEALTAVHDLLRGCLATNPTAEAAAHSATQSQEHDGPVQATVLGLHPACDGMLHAPGSEALVEQQLQQLLRQTSAL